MQIAALNIRSEADAIAKRLAVQGLCGVRPDRPPRARRRSTACASASSGRAAKRRRSRRSWKKKSSSSPGLPASARVGRPPGAQLSQVRTSRLRLDRARAAARRAGRRPPTTRTAFLLGLTTGVVYFTGTLYWITLVMAVYGGLPMWVAVDPQRARSSRTSRSFPPLFAVVMRRGARRVRRTRAGGGAAGVGGDRAGTDAIS